MKEYTVIDTSGGGIAAGGTASGTVTLENSGFDLNYAITVKGDIASLDVDIDVEVPNDAEVYDTSVDGTGSFAALDLTDGGEVRDVNEEPPLGVLRAAESVTITVTNNDASAGDATVKILQYDNE